MANVERQQKTLIERVVNYLVPQKSDVANISPSENTISPPTSYSNIIPNDTSEEHESTTTTMFRERQLKNWTCNDVVDFLHEYQFEKFTPILKEANGKYLIRLYSMSQDNNNKLLEYMREENPEIKLSDYLRFVEAIEGVVEQTNTND